MARTLDQPLIDRIKINEKQKERDRCLSIISQYQVVTPRTTTGDTARELIMQTLKDIGMNIVNDKEQINEI